jgi:hypothetical protein
MLSLASFVLGAHVLLLWPKARCQFQLLFIYYNIVGRFLIAFLIQLLFYLCSLLLSHVVDFWAIMIFLL